MAGLRGGSQLTLFVVKCLRFNAPPPHARLDIGASGADNSRCRMGIGSGPQGSPDSVKRRR